MVINAKELAGFANIAEHVVRWFPQRPNDERDLIILIRALRENDMIGSHNMINIPSERAYQERVASQGRARPEHSPETTCQ